MPIIAATVVFFTSPSVYRITWDPVIQLSTSDPWCVSSAAWACLASDHLRSWRLWICHLHKSLRFRIPPKAASSYCPSLCISRLCSNMPVHNQHKLCVKTHRYECYKLVELGRYQIFLFLYRYRFLLNQLSAPGYLLGYHYFNNLLMPKNCLIQRNVYCYY